jgi:hypothetical protein
MDWMKKQFNIYLLLNHMPYTKIFSFEYIDYNLASKFDIQTNPISFLLMYKAYPNIAVLADVLGLQKESQNL